MAAQAQMVQQHRYTWDKAAMACPRTRLARPARSTKMPQPQDLQLA